MKENKYTTRNLYEAGLLYAKHPQSFIGLEPDGRDYLFVFQGSQCKSLANHYYKGDAPVDAKLYADAIRTLKDIIFNRLRERRAAIGVHTYD